MRYLVGLPCHMTFLLLEGITGASGRESIPYKLRLLLKTGFDVDVESHWSRNW